VPRLRTEERGHFPGHGARMAIPSFSHSSSSGPRRRLAGHPRWAACARMIQARGGLRETNLVGNALCESPPLAGALPETLLASMPRRPRRLRDGLVLATTRCSRVSGRADGVRGITIRIRLGDLAQNRMLLLFSTTAGERIARSSLRGANSRWHAWRGGTGRCCRRPSRRASGRLCAHINRTTARIRKSR
jgi:hypothetical protein